MKWIAILRFQNNLRNIAKSGVHSEGKTFSFSKLLKLRTSINFFRINNIREASQIIKISSTHHFVKCNWIKSSHRSNTVKVFFLSNLFFKHLV